MQCRSSVREPDKVPDMDPGTVQDQVRLQADKPVLQESHFILPVLRRLRRTYPHH